MPPTATASKKSTRSGPAKKTTITAISRASKKVANPPQKVDVRSNRANNAAKAGRAAADPPPPVVLPSDWPVRSSSPPRLLNFYRDILQDDDDEDVQNAFGFLDQKVKSTTVAPSVPTAAAYSDPSFSSAALRPGPLLQGCSGKDIQLARNAVSGTDIAKEKGRYLLLLPGLLSLKNPPAIATAAATRTSKKKDADEDDNDTSMDNDEYEKNVEEKDCAVLTTTASALPTLGRLEQLSSATPLLKVPFLAPGAAAATGDTAYNHNFSKRTLCFPGTKVDTSSKFMMLTCSQKRGGSVTCKNIFSSVIVFGKPYWEGDEPTPSEASPIIQQTTVGLYTVASENELVPVSHYGGSARAVDGDPKRNSSHVRTSRNNVFVPRYVPRHFAPGTVAASAPTTATSTNRAKTKAPNQKSIGRPVDSNDDESSGSKSPLPMEVRDKSSWDDESSELTTRPSTSGTTVNISSPRRAAPKRKASLVVTRYFTPELSSSESSDNQEESQGNDSCNDEANENGKKPASLKTRAKSSAAGRGPSTKLAVARNGDDTDEGQPLKNAPSKRQRPGTKKETSSKGGPTTIAKKRARCAQDDCDDEKSGQDDRVDANSAPSVNRRISGRPSSIKSTMYKDASDRQGDGADDDDASSAGNASVLEKAKKEKQSLRISKGRSRKPIVGRAVENTARPVAARQRNLDDDSDANLAMRGKSKKEVVDLASNSGDADEDHHLQLPASALPKSGRANALSRSVRSDVANASTKKRARPVQNDSEDEKGDQENSGNDNDTAHSANRRTYMSPSAVKKTQHNDAANAEDDDGAFSTANASLLDGSKKESGSATQSKMRNRKPSHGQVMDDMGARSTKPLTKSSAPASKEESPKSPFRSRKRKSSPAKTPMVEVAKEIRSLPNSPFRPPRRKSPAVKAAKSGVNKVLDLTGDGEFGFLS